MSSTWLWQFFDRWRRRLRRRSLEDAASSTLGPEARAQVMASICEHALGEPAVEIEPILGEGMVNDVAVAETAERSVFLRVRFHTGDADEFRWEAWCMERTLALGVPGAEVIAVGVHEAHAYAVHTLLHGTVGTQYEGALERVWRQIGRHARLVHQVPVHGFGPHADGPRSHPTLGGWVNKWCKSIFGGSVLVDSGFMSRAAFDKAHELLLGLKGCAQSPRLCHGGLSLQNVMVGEDRTVFLVDWGNAMGHLAPQLDLAELYLWSENGRPSELDAFLDGYGMSDSECAAMADEIRRLQIWRLMSSAQWLVETGKSDATLAFLKRRAGTLLEPA